MSVHSYVGLHGILEAMTRFSAKAKPEATKLRGGYYTPSEIASAIAEWALSVDDRHGQPIRVLEPSCGDGAIIKEIKGSNLEVVGVELLESEAIKARRLGVGSIINEDFFSWEDRLDSNVKFDAGIGNPPYIRFGNWDIESRERALRLMTRSGLTPSKLTNAWVPFVVGAVNRTRPGGRVALVLPAELLQVGYASQLREYLTKTCTQISIVSFRTLVFPDVLQEVILLLLDVGEGPAQFRTMEINDSEELKHLQFHGKAIRASLDLNEKWTYYYLNTERIELLRRFVGSGVFKKLGDYAKVNVGVVTGRNSFFCMTKEQAEDLDLNRWVMPLVARSAHLRGISFTQDDLAFNESEGVNTRLLAIPTSEDISNSEALSEYILEGENAGVHTGYKTRIRKKWWSVPSVAVPDGFMLRQISTLPRIFSNETRATSTDTVHRVFWIGATGSIRQLATAALNTVSCALAEVYGRSYGGGILELEPSECVKLLVPPPELVDESLMDEVDRLIRCGNIDGARYLVDQRLLVQCLGISSEDVREFHEILSIMQSRRLNRNRRISR